MRYEDTRAAIEAALSVSGVSAFNEREAPRMGLALGSTKIGPEDTDWRVLVAVQRKEAEDAAERAVTAADGHAIVVELPVVRPQVTREWAQQRRDPLEIGQQIKPRGKPWVGTGGVFSREGDALFQITNEHVVGVGAQSGTAMEQGGDVYATVAMTGGIGPSINRYDVAAIQLVAQSRRILPRFAHGLNAELLGIRDVGPGDVGKMHVKTGRATGTTKFPCIAVGINGLEVAYDHGVARFDGIAAFAAPVGQPPASQAGDSGSAVACVEDRMADALLFAGGPASDGRDWFFACPMASAIRHLGLPPTLP